MSFLFGPVGLSPCLCIPFFPNLVGSSLFPGSGRGYHTWQKSRLNTGRFWIRLTRESSRQCRSFRAACSSGETSVPDDDEGHNENACSHVKNPARP